MKKAELQKEFKNESIVFFNNCMKRNGCNGCPFIDLCFPKERKNEDNNKSQVCKSK